VECYLVKLVLLADFFIFKLYFVARVTVVFFLVCYVHFSVGICSKQNN